MISDQDRKHCGIGEGEGVCVLDLGHDEPHVDCDGQRWDNQGRLLAPAISDEDRKLAEETFDFIDRSEASGNSYEANLPIGADEDTAILALRYSQWGLIIDALQEGADESEDADWGQDCSNLAVHLREKIYPEDVSMALAEHTASAIDKILGS